MAEPRTAPASLHPCEFYSVSGHGSARPSRTQGHHRRPVYLQMRLWGEVRIHDLKWACGTDHDSTHAWIDWLLGEARKPDPEPPPRCKAEAQAVVDWYRAERAAQGMG